MNDAMKKVKILPDLRIPGRDDRKVSGHGLYCLLANLQTAATS